MANAIDDLRYISRYGYRDPWAEASKSITDSLLAYAQSKNKRDVLIAEFEDKKRREQKTDDYNDKKLVLDLYNSTPDESKSSVLPSLQGVWGEDPTMAPVLNSLEETLSKTDEYNTTWDNLFTSTKNNKLSINERFESSQRLVEIANNPAHRSQASALFRHYAGKRNEEQQKVTYTDLGEINKTYLGDMSDEYNAAVQAGNFTGATQILNSQISKTGRSVTAISSIYDVLVKNVTDAETAFNKGEGTQEAIKSATAALERESKTLQTFLPPQYRNVPFAEGLQAALVNADISTKKRNDINKDNNGTPPPPPPQTQTQYVPINDVHESKISIPSTAMVELIDPRTGKNYGQQFTPEIASRMISEGRGEIDKTNAMVSFQMTQRDDKVEMRGITYQNIEAPNRYSLSMAKFEKRNKRITLRSGDEVIQKSTGKRFPVAISTPNLRSYTVDKVNYVVNGKKYNWKEFMNQFAKPMYDIQEVDASNQTNDLINIIKNQSSSFKIHSVQPIPD